MTNFISRPALFLTGMALIFFWGSPSVLAESIQPNWGQTNFATPEQVAFAFSRLSGQPLDLNSLIEARPSFQALPPIDQDLIRDDLFSRMTEAYAHYSPRTTPIIVGMPVKVETVTSPPALTLIYSQGQMPEWLFEIAGQKIIVQSPDFLYYTLIPLANSDVLRRKRFQIEEGMRFIAEIIPYRTIPAQKIGEKDIIQGHIARFRLVNFGGNVIWSDENPTYQAIYNLDSDRLFQNIFRQPPPSTKN